MNPQENNTPPIQPAPTDEQAEPATGPAYYPQQSVAEPPAPEPKKRSKKIAILGVIAILVLVTIGAYAAYVFFFQPKPTTADVVTPATSVDSTKTDNAELDAATDALTKSSDTEADLVTTDDSTNAADASNDVAGVEESIDENSF